MGHRSAFVPPRHSLSPQPREPFRQSPRPPRLATGHAPFRFIRWALGLRGPGRHVPMILVTARERRERELLARALRRRGYLVLLAPDGAAVLAVAEQRRPAAVVLDWLTPGHRGLEVCLRLKVRSRLRGVPVMLIAARGDGTQVSEGFAAGADEVVTRPLDVRALVRLVDRRVAWACGAGRA